MKVRLARSASADLDEIWLYIAQHGSVVKAERFLAFLTDKLYLLAKHPGIGRARPDLQPNLRSFPVGNYRIYYRREKEGILRVLHIRHAARDETKLFQ